MSITQILVDGILACILAVLLLVVVALIGGLARSARARKRAAAELRQAEREKWRVHSEKR